MREPKIWKSFYSQLESLENRGLLIHDKKRALSYLERIGYYRLSAYWFPFKKITSNGEDKFLPNSHFEEALELYVFNKRLRLLALDALERIEVSVRVDIAYLLGERDIFAHMDARNFQENFQYIPWYRKYESLMKSSKSNEFITHHNKYYDGKLPIWVATEIWDFGTLSKLYSGMRLEDKDKIARKYRLPSGRILESQLHAFNFIRNISAHHSRLWNRSIIGRTTLKGIKDPILQSLCPNQIFLYFCFMKRMLDIICPNSTWGDRFIELIRNFPFSQNNVINLNPFGLIDTLEIDSWKLWG